MTQEEKEKLVRIENKLHTAIAILEKVEGDVDRLVDKAKALVDILDDREKNHGSLVGPETLNARNELALELSRWR